MKIGNVDQTKLRMSWNTKESHTVLVDGRLTYAKN